MPGFFLSIVLTLIGFIGFGQAAAIAQSLIMPLKEVRAGQKAIGRTVFAGGNVEDFQVEILGVLENLGPKQSLILGRLSGGPLSETGVMAGMSGSPVYIDGKLAGAVALAFPFSKQAIAGIRPIEEMLAATVPQASPRAAVDSPFDTRWLDKLPGPLAVNAGGSRMIEVATPVSFAGFTRGTLEQFTPQLEALGLSPRQGQSGGAVRAGGPLGDPSKLEPGSMISVQLMSGDMTVGADGTVTRIDGTRIWAFGHRFLDAGPTEMPFARAEVITLLPSLNNSFKISAAKEWMGV
ncbi:MAG: SpoIVB peptidase S55 domain-containing protein, partial [Bryobacteraceae bacterium]